MNEPLQPSNVSLPLPLKRKIDEVCDQFEVAWNSGQHPRIENYLADKLEPERSTLLRELVALDLEFRSRSGEQPTIEEYRLRFPDHVDLICAAFDYASRQRSPNPLPDPSSTGAAPESTRTWESSIDRKASTVSQQKAGDLGHTEISPDPGSLRFGNYELLEKIAHGGMGVVYKARQISPNRIVAVKMILSGQLASAHDIRRFHTEAEAAAQLQHPNIVAIHEVGEHEGQHYFSMDYVEGDNLAALVRKNPLPAKQAARIVQTVAEAIHYAHQKGILHRDLKPSNVLMEGRESRIKGQEPEQSASGPRPSTLDSRPRITDFGLAKRIEGGPELTMSGAILGTPSYMPPEQAAGKRSEVGPRSDVYSLGATLYELLTGRPPFRAESPLDTLNQVLDTEPPPPRLLNSKIPRDLETICLKCLEKDQRRRYQSASELADDLGRYRDGMPIRARPVGFLGQSWRWCRRRPALATALGLAIVCPLLFVQSQIRGRQNAELIASEQKTKADLATKTGEESRLKASLVVAQAKALESDLLSSYVYKQVVAQADAEAFQQGKSIFLASALAQHDDPSDRAELMGTVQRSLVPIKTSPRRLMISSLLYSSNGQSFISTDLRDRAIRVWRKEDRIQEKVLGELSDDRGKPSDMNRALVERAVGQGGNEYRFQEKVLLGHQIPDERGGAWGTIRGLVERPDNPNELISAGLDGSIRVWDQAKSAEIRKYARDADSPGPRFLALAVEPGPNQVAGRRIVTGDDKGNLSWWDLDSLRNIKEVAAHSPHVLAVKYRPDGRQCASAGPDATVRLWDLDGNKLADLAPPNYKPEDPPVEMSDLAYSPDGKQLAVAAEDGRVYVWNVVSRKLQHALEGHAAGPNQLKLVRSVVFIRPSRLLSGAADGTIREWDTETGKPIRTLGRHQPNRFGNQVVRAIAVSPDGKEIATCGADDTMRIWDYQSGKPLAALQGNAMPPERMTHLPTVSAICSSKDLLITAGFSNDAAIRVWDISTQSNDTTPVRERKIITDLPDNKDADIPQRVSALAIHPDGSRFVTAEPYGDLLVFDTESGRRAHILRGHKPLVMPKIPGVEMPDFPSVAVTSLAWSHNGQKIASAGHDHHLRLWDPQTGQLLAEWPDEDPESVPLMPEAAEAVSKELLALAKTTQPSSTKVLFASDDTLLITIGNDSVVRLWDIEARKVTHRLRAHSDAVTAQALSWDGKFLASGSADGQVVIWDLKNRVLLRTAHVKPLMGTDRFGLPLQGEGTWFETAEKLRRRGSTVVQSLAFSPDTSWLAITLGDGTVSLLDMATRTPVHRGTGHEPDRVGFVDMSAYFTRHGELLTFGNDATVRQWELSSWSNGLRVLDAKKPSVQVGASRDGGEWAAVTMDATLVRWDRQSGKELTGWKQDKDGANAFAYSPNEDKIVVGSYFGQALVIDLKTGKSIAAYKGPDGKRELQQQDSITDVAIQPSGPFVATSWHDGSTELWRISDGQWERTFKGSGKRIYALAFRPDGRELAVADEEGRVTLWDVEHDRKPKHELSGPRQASGLSYSPDGLRLVQAGQGDSIVVWDPTSGKKLHTLKGHLPAAIAQDLHVVQVYGVAFGPDGRWLATCGADETIRIWDVETFQLAAVISTARIQANRTSPGGEQPQPMLPSPSLTGALQAVAFSTDSRQLIAVGFGGPVRVYDMEPIMAELGKPQSQIIPDTERATALRMQNNGLITIQQNHLPTTLGASAPNP